MTRELKSRALIVVLIGVCFILVSLCTFAPRITDQFVDSRYILSCDMGEDLTIVARFMNTQGRDRRTYDYYLRLHGDQKALLKFVNKLGVEEDDVVLSDWKRRTPRLGLKWWTPPSLSGKEYRAFHKNVGASGGETCFCRMRIELSDADLFLTKDGNLDALRNVVRDKGIKYRLFILLSNSQFL